MSGAPEQPESPDTAAASTDPRDRGDARRRPPLRFAAYAGAWLVLVALVVTVAPPEERATATGSAIAPGKPVVDAFEEHGLDLSPGGGGRFTDSVVSRAFDFWLEQRVWVRIDLDGALATPMPSEPTFAIDAATGEPSAARDDCRIGACSIQFEACGAAVHMFVAHQDGPATQLAEDVRSIIEQTIDGACRAGSAAPADVAEAFWDQDELEYAVGFSFEPRFAPHLAYAIAPDPELPFPVTIAVFEDPTAALTAEEQGRRSFGSVDDDVPSWYRGHEDVPADSAEALADTGFTQFRACNVVASAGDGDFGPSRMFLAAPPVDVPDPLAAPVPAAAPARARPLSHAQRVRAATQVSTSLERAMDELRDSCGD